MSLARKTDEYVFEITNVVEDLIQSCYDMNHSDSRERNNNGTVIAISSDSTVSFDVK